MNASLKSENGHAGLKLMFCKSQGHDADRSGTPSKS
jgi:hypothetical protein